VPIHFGRTTLTHALRHHSDLQCSDGTGPGGSDYDSVGNGASVHTLAPDHQFQDQVATVRFQCLPSCLEKLEAKVQQVTIDLCINPADPPDGAKGGSLQAVKVTIDEHFNGITVLSAPASDEHEIDVLAVSGLGSHPFGSFVNKEDGHMWLSESLVRDMPSARVMIYGYQSGLWKNASIAHVGDLAGPLQIALSSLLRCKDKTRLILLGHSLGGLLIQEALIRIAESDFNSELLDVLLGVLFFGVPNDGMAIESLIPIVNDQPNRFLVESLNPMNSQVLEIQARNFLDILERTNFELFCFYETELSKTAAMVSTIGTVENLD